jgi:hypothetical protein
VPDTEIVDNAAQSRFETVIDGHLAKLDYRRDGERLVLVHTEVPEALGGNGLGGQLVSAAVDAAAAAGLTVVPECPYAAEWLQRHPDVAGKVTIDWPDR